MDIDFNQAISGSFFRHPHFGLLFERKSVNFCHVTLLKQPDSTVCLQKSNQDDKKVKYSGV